jgi:hypothetical protein
MTRILSNKGIIVVVISGFCGLYLPASAQERMTPQQIFYDDGVLSAAVGNIASMDKEELDAFANFIAACTDELSDNEIIQHDCNAAREKYRIEFSRDRPLDRLINVLELTSSYMRSSEKVGKKDDGKMIQRSVDIETKLKDAANLMFGALRPSKKSN